MPAFVKLEFEDPTQNHTTLVFPGDCMRVCAEDENGMLSGFITIACDEDDISADVFEQTDPQARFTEVTPEDVIADCNKKLQVASLGDKQREKFFLIDAEHGVLQIIVSHSVIMSSN